MNRTITITAMHRPHLLWEMLQSLVANELDGWTIHVGVEPSSAAGEIVQICESMLGARADVRVNDRVLGISGNPYEVQRRAFASGSQVNLYLEEDLLVASDATQLALWYAENHRPNWLCLNLLATVCGSTGSLSEPNCPSLLFENRTFNSIGFALRHQEWQRYIEPVWERTLTPRRLKGRADWRVDWGWDWGILALMAEQRQLASVQPVLARATHNGPEGTYCRTAFHEEAFGGLPMADGRHEFQLEQVVNLPRSVRSIIGLQQEQLILRGQLPRSLMVKLRRESERAMKGLSSRSLRQTTVSDSE
ncbi:hypothetical protein [Terrihabitans rhizophilus]|jgi:hypothetical protein|uniref:Glycosyl transferase family 2 n=1 Tax=Terrihabitans rhizophilus TaxID=3092662 RepID=A0ABU4RK45_9HYPH|nr:hypothetical protein [Terrihabitans sp. PJ23]MDX6805206.1 hypothetical protein [Terrihabitans sp. PJ23]